MKNLSIAQMAYWHEIDSEPWKSDTPMQPYNGICLNIGNCCYKINDDYSEKSEICNPKYRIQTKSEKAYLARIKNKKMLVIKVQKYIRKASLSGEDGDGEMYDDSFVFDLAYYKDDENIRPLPHLTPVDIHFPTDIKLVTYESYEFDMFANDSFDPSDICRTCTIKSEEHCKSCPLKNMKSKIGTEIEFSNDILIETSFVPVKKIRRRYETIPAGRKILGNWEYERMFYASHFWIIKEKTVIKDFVVNEH